MTDVTLTENTRRKEGRLHINTSGLKVALLSVVDRLVLTVQRVRSPEIASLFNAFPKWNILPLSIIKEVSSQTRKIAQELGLYTNETFGELIEHTLTHKKFHLIGAVGSSGQGTLEAYKIKAKAIACIELLVSDYPDTFGDYGKTRSIADSRLMYSIGLSSVTHSSIPETNISNPSKQPLIDFLLKLKELTTVSLDKVFNRISSDEVRKLARKTTAKIAREYTECVQIMHIQDEGERLKIASAYLVRSENDRRKVCAWLDEPTLWYDAQGSTLGVFGVINECALNPNLTQKDINEVRHFFDQVVPFIHVLLDDSQDRQEDKKLGDPNLLEDLLSGKYIHQVEILEKEFGVDQRFNGYTSNPELATLYFFSLLGKAYKQKEKDLIKAFGRKRSEKHIRLARDMIRFYQYKLIKDGFSSDSIENRAMQELAKVVT